MKSILKPIACALAALFLLLPGAAGCSQEDPTETTDSVLEGEAADNGASDDETEVLPGGGEEDADGAQSPEEGDEPAPDEPDAPEESEEPDESEEEPEEEPQPAQAQYVMVITDGLNVRTGAGTGYASLGQADKDTLLQYDGTVGSWYKTTYRNSIAYISAKSGYTVLVTMTLGSETVERVIEEGLKLLGTPYVYGAVRLHDGKGTMLKGFTLTAFDCSSLTQYMFYYGAGVLLDTTTRTQVLQGRTVEKAELQRGDLLFFTNSSRYYNTGIERIGHVAVYLGDNYILHTSSDFAKIEQISAQRWSYYITARRMV